MTAEETAALRRAASAVLDASAALNEARRELNELIVAAREGGDGLAEIASVVGFSPQRIHQITTAS